MIKRFAFLFLFFYFLALLQASFLPHFGAFFTFFNAVLVAVLVLNFFEPAKERSGIASAAIGGLFLDMFSGQFFGFWTALSVALAVFLKLFVKKYVRFPFLES